jgi:outer membrane protein OmpA-like peptidoglycan-associated protein
MTFIQHHTWILCCLMTVLTAYAQAQPPRGGTTQPKKTPADYGIRSRDALKAYEEGSKYQQYRERERAADYFKLALEYEPNFLHAHYNLGVCLSEIPHPPFSVIIQHLEKVAAANRQKDFPWTNYYLGLAYLNRYQYDKASKQLELALAANVLDPRRANEARLNLKKAAFAAEAIKNPIQFNPQNMGGKINTKWEEYMPSLTADGQTLFFCSRREGNIGGYNAARRTYLEDFYYSVRDPKTNEYTEAVNLGPPVNTPQNEGAATFSQDGQFVIFTACDREDGFGNCDLYASMLNGKNWSTPVNLGPGVNSPEWDTQPCLSHDGKTLYFVSLRPGGLGESDIYTTTLLPNGRWSKPKNLGAPINTPGREFNPFISADGQTLYFSSDYHLGFGETDVFMSRLDPEKGWGEPINLGHPFNSPGEEQGMVINTAGTHGYFSSSRDSEFGMNDIYMFELDPRIRPKPVPFLRGLVVDSITNAPLGARVMLVDVDLGDTIRRVNSNTSTGKFLCSIPFERDYAASVSAPGYAFHSQAFTLKNLKDQVNYDLTIRLKPLAAGTEVVLKNIYFDFDKAELLPRSIPELKTLLGYLKDNPSIKAELQGHTDSQGTDEYNLKLSTARAKAVETWLVNNGIKAERLVSKGYGESQPVASNDTETGRALNRRMVMKILEVKKP